MATAWPHSEILKFLEYYRAETIIWNPKHKNHKDKNKVSDAWNRISNNMGIPVEDLKKKKETLMTAFRTNLKKKKESIRSGAGLDDIYTPSWPFFEIMESFLRDVYECKSIINTDGGGSTSLDDEDSITSQNENIENEDPNATVNSEINIPVIRRRSRNPPELQEASNEMKRAFSSLNSVLSSKKQKIDSEDDCDLHLSFMQRYGYLPAPADADVQPAYTPRSVADAVRRMQAFAGLPPTGVLDEETKQLFTRKRCGVKDIPNPRRRRFVITQGWANKSISFRVMNGAKLLSQHQVEELMTAALAVWAPYGGLQFVRKDAGKADIEVSFTTGDHGDMTPFDGPGQALAHAFGPPTGAMHFDDDELWVGHMTSSEDDDDFYEMTDFFAVAVHEAGHALGLWHSEVPSSVMYPYYQGTVELDMDDIMAMHELYSKDDSLDRTLGILGYHISRALGPEHGPSSQPVTAVSSTSTCHVRDFVKDTSRTPASTILPRTPPGYLRRRRVQHSTQPRSPTKSSHCGIHLQSRRVNFGPRPAAPRHVPNQPAYGAETIL
ncbi:unnamed protein product [Plutella xylostella]|uniref:(diamondback moth) hypothetical protein n=1 Tax=Plutella xylostella TaxID=51655 RepID=A0A8S4DA82_PLUXY|nr:unnamed protein product [Plutella xylostella]